MNPAFVAQMIKRQTAGQKKSNDGAACAESTHERCNLIGTVSDAPSIGELKTGRLISANLRDACNVFPKKNMHICGDCNRYI